MNGINKAIIVGTLGADPELRHTNGGKATTTISVATSESWNDSNGQKQERTEWHKIVLWERLAEIAGQYLKKGSQVYVEGKIQTRKWQDKEGHDRYTTEIRGYDLQMLGGKGSGTAPEAANGTPPQHRYGAAAPKAPRASEEAPSSFDDTIPF